MKKKEKFNFSFWWNWLRNGSSSFTSTQKDNSFWLRSDWLWLGGAHSIPLLNFISSCSIKLLSLLPQPINLTFFHSISRVVFVCLSCGRGLAQPKSITFFHSLLPSNSNQRQPTKQLTSLFISIKSTLTLLIWWMKWEKKRMNQRRKKRIREKRKIKEIKF